LTRVPVKSVLWDAFVRVIGGNRQKKRAVRRFITAPGRILEIGCATGNLAAAFEGFDYVGIDTDCQGIELAKWRRTEPTFRFHCLDVLAQDFPEAAGFDYVLISHTLHHVADDVARRLVERSRQLLAPGGMLLVLDMIRPDPGEPFRKQFYYRLDRGEHIRTLDEWRAMFSTIRAFPHVDFHVIRTTKLGIEVIDQVAIRASAAP